MKKLLKWDKGWINDLFEEGVLAELNEKYMGWNGRNGWSGLKMWIRQKEKPCIMFDLG